VVVVVVVDVWVRLWRRAKEGIGEKMLPQTLRYSAVAL